MRGIRLERNKPVQAPASGFAAHGGPDPMFIPTVVKMVDFSYKLPSAFFANAI